MKKTVCITGADRGLGLALTGEWLRLGWQVFAGRYLADSHDLEDLKKAYPVQLQVVGMDISQTEGVREAAAIIADKTDALDILVNNAAVLGDTTQTIEDDLDFEDMARTLNVNALGTLRVSNALIHLVKKGGEKLIVNISSEAGSIGNSYRESWFGYCMSKSAINMQSTIIHNHIRGWGGQVLVFDPGWMQTFMSGRRNLEATFPPEEAAARIVKLVMNHQEFQGEQPAYITNTGKRLSW